MAPELLRRFARYARVIAPAGPVVADDPDAVRELVMAASPDAGALTQLAAGPAVERFCDLVLSTGEERLCNIAVSCGYAPADEQKKALFLLVTGQRELLMEMDPLLLVSGYASAGFAQRRAAVRAACRCGCARLLLDALLQAGLGAAISCSEWEALAVAAGDPWRLLLSAPPPVAAGIWSSLRDATASPPPGYHVLVSRLRSCDGDGWHYPDPSPVLACSLQSPGCSVARSVLSPDGSVLAAGGLDGSVSFWSLPGGALLAHAPAHGGNVSALAWSPDGRFLATAGACSILVWDTRDHAVVSSHVLPKETLRSVAWAGEELFAACGHSVWHAASGGACERYIFHEEDVLSFVPLTAHGLLLSGDRAGCLSLQPICGETSVTTVRAHRQPVRHIHVEWPYCITVTDRGATACWTLPDLTSAGRDPGHRSRLTAFAASGPFHATADATGEILLRRPGSDGGLLTLRVHKGGVLSLAIGPGGALLAAGSADGTVRCWNTAAGRLLWEKKGHEAAVRQLEATPSGEALVSTSDDGTIRLWRLQDGQPVATPGRPKQATVTAIAPFGERVITGDRSGYLMEGDLAAGRVTDLRFSYTTEVKALVSITTHRLLAVGSPDGLWLWDADSRAPLKKLEGHEGSVQALAVSPDGSLLASSGWDQTVRLWSVPGGEPAGTLEGHQSAVQALVFSSDGTLVSAGNDRTVRVWDLAAGRLRYTLRGHRHVVSSLASFPGTGVVASGSWDGTIRLWDYEQGICLDCIEGSEARILSLAADPAGSLLASGSSDGVVRLWTAPDCRPVRVRSGSPGALATLAFSADGRLLLTGDPDGGVRAWRLPWTGPLVSATPADLAAVSSELAAGGRMPERERREWEFLAALLRGACLFDIEYAGAFACPGPYDIELAE